MQDTSASLAADAYREQLSGDKKATLAMVRARLPHPWVRARATEICLRHANGETYASIAASLGVSTARIGQIFIKTRDALLRYGPASELHVVLTPLVRREAALRMLRSAGIKDTAGVQQAVQSAALADILNTDGRHPERPSLKQAGRVLERTVAAATGAGAPRRTSSTAIGPRWASRYPQGKPLEQGRCDIHGYKS